MVDSSDLMELANSFKRGYLKKWKADGIMYEMSQRNRFGDCSPVRIKKWIRGCLLMEGFRKDDCDKIADWLLENLENM